MAIKVACPACGKRLRARDRHAGRRAKCAACGGAIEVPVPVAAVPNGSAPHWPSRRPAAARDVMGAGPGTDDGEWEYVSPPFRPPASGAVAAGHDVPGPPLAGRGAASRRLGLPRDPWLYRLSRSLGLASLMVGGAILVIGLPANQAWGGGGPGAALVVVVALAALVAGAGLLLLVDVARSFRRLGRCADGEAGVE